MAKPVDKDKSLIGRSQIRYRAITARKQSNSKYKIVRK